RRLLQRSGERAVLFALRARERGDAVQVILRLVAVALFDLPQPVILPGLDVVGIGFQRALVPDLRDLVVAELEVGVAGQIGDRGDVVAVQRLQLLDGGSVYATLVDRRIGRAIACRERSLFAAGADDFALLFLLAAVGGRRIVVGRGIDRCHDGA